MEAHKHCGLPGEQRQQMHESDFKREGTVLCVTWRGMRGGGCSRTPHLPTVIPFPTSFIMPYTPSMLCSFSCWHTQTFRGGPAVVAMHSTALLKWAKKRLRQTLITSLKKTEKNIPVLFPSVPALYIHATCVPEPGRFRHAVRGIARTERRLPDLPAPRFSAHVRLM